ncbi:MULTISPECIES: MepB family protein [Rothia]|uniref:MepB family protein n=1 Tax=Rothia TaxID=32207 RepID=UPI001F3FC79D|nr:MepB family protein [Rothia nasimurium]
MCSIKTHPDSATPVQSLREKIRSFQFLDALIKSGEIDEIQQVTTSPYNSEYEALTFSTSENSYQSRMGRKTPKKNGYFLALWQKDATGSNIPFTAKEFCDYLLVFISDGHLHGYFSFPRKVLAERGILASEGKRGKMAFRVYPSWCVDLNPSAHREQSWQLHYWSAM